MKSSIHLYLYLAVLCALPFTCPAQEWPIHVLRDSLVGAWTRSGDFNLDGVPDVLVQAGDSIYWYENMRSGWNPHLVDPTFYNSAYSYLDVLDLDSDGDLDVIKAADSGTCTDSLSWNENRSNGSEWVKHNLLRMDGSIGWMASSYGDLDGDNDIDVVVPEVDFINDPPLVRLHWLENGGNSGTWEKHLLREGNHWFSTLADIDGDNDLDIVSSWEGIFWLENKLPDTSWLLHTVDDTESARMGVCRDMNGDGDQDIVTVLNSGTIGLVYYANPSWDKVGINAAGKNLILGAIGDINQDNAPDVTYGGAGFLPQGMGWAENPNHNANWVLHGLSPHDLLQRIPTGIDDIDGDGDQDIIFLSFDVNTGIGAAAWAENLIVVGVSSPLSSARIPTIEVSPNPTAGEVRLSVQGPPGDYHLTASNLFGQIVLQEMIRSTGRFEHTVDLSSLPAGSYLLVVSNEEGWGVEKVVRR